MQGDMLNLQKYLKQNLTFELIRGVILGLGIS